MNKPRLRKKLLAQGHWTINSRARIWILRISVLWSTGYLSELNGAAECSTWQVIAATLPDDMTLTGKNFNLDFKTTWLLSFYCFTQQQIGLRGMTFRLVGWDWVEGELGSTSKVKLEFRGTLLNIVLQVVWHWADSKMVLRVKVG